MNCCPTPRKSQTRPLASLLLFGRFLLAGLLRGLLGTLCRSFLCALRGSFLRSFGCPFLRAFGRALLGALRRRGTFLALFLLLFDHLHLAWCGSGSGARFGCLFLFRAPPGATHHGHLLVPHHLHSLAHLFF